MSVEPISDNPDDQEPDTVATPEGDGEGSGPVPDGMQIPPGNAPTDHIQETPKKKPTGIEKFIDEVERGEYM